MIGILLVVCHSVSELFAYMHFMRCLKSNYNAIKNSGFDYVFEQPSYSFLAFMYIYILQLSTFPGLSWPLVWQNIPQPHIRQR